MRHKLTDPQSIYYEDPNKATPTPTPSPTKRPTPRPTQSTVREDPYEAHLFDDPDEYSFYWAEEFAEESGENYEEGDLEAYDHWEYWHEDDKD